LAGEKGKVFSTVDVHCVKYNNHFSFIVHNGRQKGRDRGERHRRRNIQEIEGKKQIETDRGEETERRDGGEQTEW
jgi:hypothetical protein